MKKHILTTALLVAALALTSCSKTADMITGGPVGGGGGGSINPGGTTPTASDNAQVTNLVTVNTDLIGEQVWETNLMSSDFGGSVPTGRFAAVRPLAFRRVITGVQKSMDIEYSAPDSTGAPTLALVTLHKRLTGNFLLFAGAADSTDTTRRVVTKPIDDDWTRRVLLVRTLSDDDSSHSDDDTVRVRWRLIGASGAEVHTRGGATHIQSVRVRAGAFDTTVTNPLELHRLRRVLRFPPNTPVEITVTTGNASDIVMFYSRDGREGPSARDIRRRFLNNGNGTFTFVFPNLECDGIRHFGVDAMSRGTLFDDAASYDSNAWLFPFTGDPRRERIDRR